MHKPDMLLESDVQEELDWDPQVDDTRITIKADGGNVTLSGSVPSYYQATRAADDVTVVGGVTGIDNQLLVGLLGETMNDADITVASAAALDADKFVPKGAVAADVLERMPLPDAIAVVFKRADESPTVEVDPEQLAMVLTNLITNAAQAMPDGGTLTIESSVADGRASIAVSDTGVGIPPAHREKVLQPLFTTKAKGIGLGLAVAKSLTEANRGTLTLDSQPGHGTRFVVSFPR